jgi:hypothetical protein
VPALAPDLGAAAGPGDVEPAGGEGAAEHHLARVLADVHEAADADDLAVEAADVDVAACVDLREGQEGEVETAAVVEIELVGLVDHRPEIPRRAGLVAGRRRAADQSLLVGEHDHVEHVLFRAHDADAGRDAGTQVADRTGEKLHCAAARHHLAWIERERLERRQRFAQLAGIGRRIVGAVGLALLGVDHDEVHHHAGDLHLLAGQGAALGQTLDLHDHHAAGTPRRLGHRQHLAVDRLLLHGDVAVLVRRRSAQQRHVDLERLEEEPLLALQRDQLDQVLGRAVGSAWHRRGADRPACAIRSW